MAPTVAIGEVLHRHFGYLKVCGVHHKIHRKKKTCFGLFLEYLTNIKIIYEESFLHRVGSCLQIEQTWMAFL